MSAPIYLDYNATTPVDPRVLEAMLPYLAGHYGNPSSDHVLGQRAKAALVSVMLADSACHAADHAVSGVLAAMGLTREAAAGAVRLSLGRFTTGSEIDAAATALIGARKPLTA